MVFHYDKAGRKINVLLFVPKYLHQCLVIGNCILIVAGLLLFEPASRAGVPPVPHMSASDIQSLGRQLRANLDAGIKASLSPPHGLINQVNYSSQVAKYFPENIDITDAEAVLKSAGMSVLRLSPKFDAKLQMTPLVSASLSIHQNWFLATGVQITLFASANDPTATRIGTITAFITNTGL